MMFIDDTQILQVLRGYNPWWATKQVPASLAPPVKRLAFYEIVSLLNRNDLHRTIILSGARRVGKTTILYQLCQYFIENGVPANHILYATFDHPILKMTPLQQVVEIFINNVSADNQNLVLLFDEIHYANEWSLWLKRLGDENPTFKIIATGSASVELNTKGTESGVGRWIDVKIPTLSFYEYIRLKGIDVPDLTPDTKPTSLPNLTPEDRNHILSSLAHLEQHFHRYLLTGGFPETVRLEDDLSLAQRLLREDVVDRVLKRDMTATYNIANPFELERLFLYLCMNSGGIVNQEKLAQNLGVSRTTVSRYIQYLELAHLVYRLNPVHLTTTKNKALRPRSKIYLADCAIRNAVLLRGDEILADNEEMGMMVETAVVKHIRAFYYTSRPEIGYWKGDKDKEVDIVVRSPYWEILIEIKYRKHPQIEADSGLYQYAAQSDKPLAGLVITKSATDFGPVTEKPDGEFTPFMVPAFVFLYLLGHAEYTGYRCHRRKPRNSFRG